MAAATDREGPASPAPGPAAPEQPPLDVIYDCDNTMGHPRREIDDGLTLLYLLGRAATRPAAPRLVAVTTTFGNGPEEVVHECTRRLLHELGRDREIPLLRGARAAGDWDTEAAAFVAERASAPDRPLAVLATGPLGNLAGAVARSPRLFASLDRLGCMGGYLRAPLRVGWRALGELNLSADPAASARVLSEAPPLTRVALFSGHVCLQASFGLASYRRLRRQARWPRHRLRQVRDWLIRFAARSGVPRFYLWDLLPAVWLDSPGLFSGERFALRSDPAALARGLLCPADEPGPATLGLPSQIVDRAGFYERLFAGWRRVYA